MQRQVYPYLAVSMILGNRAEEKRTLTWADQTDDNVRAGAACKEHDLVLTTTVGTALVAANARRGFRSAPKPVPSVEPAD
ncbi:hypothetical protein [Isoptericola sp. NPDC057191]|uniref:hypothetical protein n=1 Tax=Isoptericola sp. NPDC057191 TaxID=3346041 RepID=UPI00362FCDBB